MSTNFVKILELVGDRLEVCVNVLRTSAYRIDMQYRSPQLD